MRSPHIVEVIDRFTAAQEWSNTAAETTVYTKTVKAGRLGTNGALELVILAEFLNNQGANRTLNVRGKFGATTFYASTAVTLATNASRRAIVILLRIHAAGATNAQVCSGQVIFGGTGTVAGSAGNVATSTRDAIHDAVAEDTTADKDLVVTIQMDLADVNVAFKILTGSLTIRPAA